MAGAPTAGERCHRIHLDAVGGAAGDMFVAALLDCFPDLVDRILSDVAAVLPDGSGAVRLERGMSGGMRCLRFGLHQNDAPKTETRGHVHPHDHHHGHSHDHGNEAKQVDHDHDRPAAHGTSFAALRTRIGRCELSPGTSLQAIAILTVLAEAEAHIHGVAVDDVHFHEVGDWDSLMDVVAAGSIAAALGPIEWTVSELPRGSGLVRTAHGLLPVPAPATVQILKGFGWRDDGVSGERVTPTGAAILRHLCRPHQQAPGHTGMLVAAGTGAGTKHFAALPNILRATAFMRAEQDDTPTEIVVLAFDVDDMTGEELAVAASKLRGEPGVLDLTLATLSGKKGRLATRFELLLRPDAFDHIAEACFVQTSTIGLRWRREQRRVLERHSKTSEGVRVKIVARPGAGSTGKAESDDLQQFETLKERRAAARRAAGAVADE